MSPLPRESERTPAPRSLDIGKVSKMLSRFGRITPQERMPSMMVLYFAPGYLSGFLLNSSSMFQLSRAVRPFRQLCVLKWLDWPCGGKWTNLADAPSVQQMIAKSLTSRLDRTSLDSHWHVEMLCFTAELKALEIA